MPTISNTPSASYLTVSSVLAQTTTFGGATHTSSNGTDRCLVAITAIRKNGAGTGLNPSLTWNSVSMARAEHVAFVDASNSREISLGIFTLNDPAASTAGAISLDSGIATGISAAQIWFYNVEACPSGAKDASANASASGGTTSSTPSVTIIPSAVNSLFIGAIALQDAAKTIAWTTMSENDEKRESSSLLNTSIASGTLASAGSQSVAGTLSATDNWGMVGATFIGVPSVSPTAGTITMSANSPAVTYRPLVEPEACSITVNANNLIVSFNGITGDTPILPFYAAVQSVVQTCVETTLKTKPGRENE